MKFYCSWPLPPSSLLCLATPEAGESVNFEKFSTCTITHHPIILRLIFLPFQSLFILFLLSFCTAPLFFFSFFNFQPEIYLPNSKPNKHKKGKLRAEIFLPSHPLPPQPLICLFFPTQPWNSPHCRESLLLISYISFQDVLYKSVHMQRDRKIERGREGEKENFPFFF